MYVENDDEPVEYEEPFSASLPLNRWESLAGRRYPKLHCYGSQCHPGLSWCSECDWEKGKDCPKLEWPDSCDACEQYPEKPVPPEPDPNQVTFGW